ncbi:MAG TPA: IS1634 family transposase [Thermoguttaceae bacterium]|nr:IS1634 family transposase [Thermoguttaceae bacterium]
MYIARVPNRSSPPAYLLRESYREGGKVKNRTLANLSHLPIEQIEQIRRVLKGENLVAPGEAFSIQRSLPHGHVEVVLGMIRKLGLDRLLSRRRSRERDLVVAMIAQRLLFPCSKLATTRHWHSTTLAEELGVANADEEELYAALDWLLERQPSIEGRLAKEHLSEGALVLYDVTSSYYEGRTCPLARYGHNRDGKKDRPIIVYGLLTDGEGRPVAVDVYPGNTGDPTTVPDQVTKLGERFGLQRVILVGDRGMLTQAQIEALQAHPELGWISALRSGAIRGLLQRGELQRSLFDEMNLAEIESAEFPGERLVACFNPLLADERRRKREALLAATEKELAKLARQVARRTKRPMLQAEIALRAGRLVDRFKMAKHFELSIADGEFRFARRTESIERESQLDGIYVIRTSEPASGLSAGDAVRDYKRLAEVEQAFRSLKSIDLLVRPIYHRTDEHVRAHIFVCLLAYYVQWHLKRAWAPLLFEDEELARDRGVRDPVASAEPSASAKRKKATHRTPDELPVHSFRTLIAELATRCRHTCVPAGGTPDVTFAKLTDVTPFQAEAFRLAGLKPADH